MGLLEVSSIIIDRLVRQMSPYSTRLHASFHMSHLIKGPLALCRFGWLVGGLTGSLVRGTDWSDGLGFLLVNMA